MDEGRIARSGLTAMAEVVARFTLWPPRVRLGARVVVIAAITWIATGLIHEALVLLVALALPRLAGSWVADQIVDGAPVNRVYLRAMVDLAGTIAPLGLAVPSPFGNHLHAILPPLFVSPDDTTTNGWVVATIAPGSTLLARLLVSAVVNVVVLAAGLALTTRGIGARRFAELTSPLAVVGLVAQLVVVSSVLRAPLTADDLEATGALPFLFHELLRLPTASYDRTLELLAGVQPLVTLLGLLGLSVCAVGLAALLPMGKEKGERGGRIPFPLSPFPFPLVLLVLLVAATPLGDVLAVQTQFLDAPPAVARERDAGTVPAVTTGLIAESAPDVVQPPAVETPVAGAVGVAVAPADARSIPRGAVTVRVAGRDGRFTSIVGDGTAAIRGMGYNVMYAALPLAERVARYQRDFAALREIGANTVTGWRPAEFDEVLLNAAYRSGLGVLMPFQLDPTARYADPAVRQAVTADVLAWVARYRHHPAVRMWAIGNETFMEMKDHTRWQAFADFYADLVLAVRSADPDHPVLYRDAEDVYLPPLRDAMVKRGGPPIGFVYGMNFYTFRLKDVLADWPKKKFDVPVMVSEFAPGGLSRTDRPDGFRRLWTIIQTHRAFVVGAAPYVWSTDGPEPVDRLFGFVDADGRPLDGSVNTFRDLYQTAAAQDSTRPTAIPPLAGLAEAEARRQLAAAGIAAGPTEYLPRQEVRDRLLEARAVPGRVFAQQPAAGTPISAEVRVKLTVIAPEPSAGRGRFLP